MAGGGAEIVALVGSAGHGVGPSGVMAVVVGWVGNGVVGGGMRVAVGLT